MFLQAATTGCIACVWIWKLHYTIDWPDKEQRTGGGVGSFLSYHFIPHPSSITIHHWLHHCRNLWLTLTITELLSSKLLYSLMRYFGQIDFCCICQTLLEDPELQSKALLVGSSLTYQLCQRSPTSCSEIPQVQSFLQTLEKTLKVGCEEEKPIRVKEVQCL